MNYKEYNSLPKEDKKLFEQAHAPSKLAVNEVLMARFRAKYLQGAKTWAMPSLEEMGHLSLISTGNKEVKVLKNLQYVAMNRNSLAIMEGQRQTGETLGDNRGQYKDVNGVVHRDIYKQGNFFFKKVVNLDDEIELLSKIFVKAEAPQISIVKPVEVEKTEVEKPIDKDEKEIYDKWLEATPRLSKKEYAKEAGVSLHILNRIIKDNEQV